MKFHKEGYVTLLATLIFIAVTHIGIHHFFGEGIILYISVIIDLFLLITVLQFFRNPNRAVFPDDSLVLAPADGKVVVIEETIENEYFKDKRIQVSIFMSPVNVHVNRNPISGIVKYAKYHPGLHLVAWHPKSSTDNERTTIVIKNHRTEILLRQIAGALARRICYYINEGQKVEQGKDFGFIKFGSRVDVFFPIGTKIEVKIGEAVTGNKTILARV